MSDTPNRSLAIPVPGVDLVPDGWWKSTVIPWADGQSDGKSLKVAAAQLDGLIAAYETLDADTLELMRARRYLELRWGELLGPAKPGPPKSSHASEDLNKDDTYRFRQLANMRNLVLERLNAATDADEVTRAAILRLSHVSQNTGENEWYTPVEFIDAAIEVMGGIDLDPASSIEANKLIGAETFYTKENSGLDQPWEGRVWLNPPYTSDLVTRFADKLTREYKADRVDQACLLTNNATETQWFQKTVRVANAVCFPDGRITYWNPDRTSRTPLQGQVVLYFGSEVRLFRSTFGELGAVLVT